MMNQIEIEQNYTSRDLTIVAYLVASGFPLESYKENKDGLMLFTFSNSSELQKHISQFYCMTATVNPSVYYNTLRSLKSVLRSGNRQYQYETNNEHYVEQLNKV